MLDSTSTLTSRPNAVANLSGDGGSSGSGNGPYGFSFGYGRWKSSEKKEIDSSSNLWQWPGCCLAELKDREGPMGDAG